MNKVAIIAALAGIAGAALTQFGVINVMPIRNWAGVAIVGGLVAIFTRTTSD